MSRETERCLWIHHTGMAVRLNRFAVDEQPRYRAQSGGPVRSTREQAVADECQRSHEPWVVETAEAELLDCDPQTGAWWTGQAARRYVEQGEAPWAFPRSAIGLPIE